MSTSRPPLRLREDFWQHKVLVFRGQHLSPDAHVEAVRIFDEPFDHPLWLHRHEDNRLVYIFNLEQAGHASRWHVGGAWRNPPFNIESLTYQVVPEIGGQARCGPTCRRPTTGSPSRSSSCWSRSAPCTAPDPGDGTYDRPPVTETVEHPVVRTHRHTGRKGLFLSSSALRLTGIEPTEGASDACHSCSRTRRRPTTRRRFGWKPGDFVIWDNQATWHFAVNDYDGPRAYRKVIGG